VSRAARAPSRLDRDFFETSGPILVLKGGDFQSEQLIAYEVGYRTEPSPRLSASISTFYNVYSNLRSFELSPSGGLPVTIENQMIGETYGVEAWANYQVADWWRLTGGVNWLHKDLRLKPGSRDIGGVQAAGDDPAYQLSLRSSMNLPHDVTLDTFLRNVGALPSPASPAYVELNGRLAWALSKSLEVSITGTNLLHAHHLEFGSTPSAVQLGPLGVETGRSILVGFRWMR
jgi:iron complex outermembrane receptor protein